MGLRIDTSVAHYMAITPSPTLAPFEAKNYALPFTFFLELAFKKK